MIIDGDEGVKINRTIAPFDVFPTVLDIMGYELKDGRANLGISAFSNQQTLAEIYGQKQLNELFKSNQKLATFLWDQKS
jgi:phosphoglycerol transferase